MTRPTRRRGRVAFSVWVAAYVVAVLVPLAVALVGAPPGRGFWINFSVALGYVGIVMFGLQFLIASRSIVVTRPVGIDLVMRFHREVSILATMLVLAHPIILFVVDARFLELLDVRTAPVRARFAVSSVVLLLVLVTLSLLRRQLRIPYEWWQFTHAVLAVAVVLLAVAHMTLVSYYLGPPLQRVVWTLLLLAFVYLGVWERLIQPRLRYRERWLVEEIVSDAPQTTTISIRLADATAGRTLDLEPGQFAWILARRSPFAMTYHPFSISSSADRPDRLSFTVREHRGFTREIARLSPGDSVYLDGPFGGFSLPDESTPLVLVGAGVGVTPLLSVLNTLADRGDRRRVVVWLGNRDEESIVGAGRLDELCEGLDLEVHHVLSKPPADWTGYTGRLEGHLVARLHESAPEGAVYFVCGPDAMMDVVERMLVALDVDPDVIHSERFAMV